MEKEISQKTLQDLKALRNIGESCAHRLAAAGITPEILRTIGAEEACLRLFECHGMCCMNACFLYALEGAITDTPWNQIPESRKKKFKQFTADFRASLRPQ